MPTLLKLLHNSIFGAHVGEDKCVKTARKKYFFYKMQPRISEYIKACETCARFKGHTHPEAPILTMPPPSQPFERVAMDVVTIGPSSSGNDKILTMICCFSRYCCLVAIPNKRPETIIQAFNDHWVCTFGTPNKLLTDNGGEFCCQQMDKKCIRLLGRLGQTYNATKGSYDFTRGLLTSLVWRKPSSATLVWT